jgi:hypothetical protein
LFFLIIYGIQKFGSGSVQILVRICPNHGSDKEKFSLNKMDMDLELFESLIWIKNSLRSPDPVLEVFIWNLRLLIRSGT